MNLQKWDENFYTGTVGGPGFLARQLQRGRLANGTTLASAFGLTVGEYRGLPMVQHSGNSGGYRTIITRFPSAHTTVVALCNTSDANTTALSHAVADVILAQTFTKLAPERRAPAAAAQAVASGPAPSASELAALAGRYYAWALGPRTFRAGGSPTLSAHGERDGVQRHRGHRSRPRHGLREDRYPLRSERRA